MELKRTVALTVTAAALVVAPLTLATAADAATPYSVSVLHCGGGIAIHAYPTHLAALAAVTKTVRDQLKHPGTLHTVQLRHGSIVLSTSKRPC
jgi:hypothetical protein